MTDYKLDRTVKSYCFEILNNTKLYSYVEVKTKHKKKNRQGKGYKKTREFMPPAMVAVCCRSNDLGRGYSHAFSKGYYVGELYEKIEEVRKKNLQCKNILGHCAEQHAARNLMKKCPKVVIADINFSRAYRPRTQQTYDYCDNCKNIFEQLK